MDTIFKCAGIAVVGAILALTTRKYNGSFAVLVTLAVIVVLTTVLLGLLKPVLGFLQRLQGRAELGDGMITPVLRTLAVGFLTETGKNICEEAGEKTMGQVLSAAGSVAAVYVLLPLMESVLSLLEQML